MVSSIMLIFSVQAHVTLDSSRRGDIAIYLTSPHGTKSQLLARRPHDSSRAGFHDWPFLTVFCWGENPAGTWELEIQNDGRYEVTLRAWSMTFHGTTDSPDQASAPAPIPVIVPSPSPSPAPTAKAYVPPSQPSIAPVVPKAPESVAYHAPVPSSSPTVEHCASLARPGWCGDCEVGYRTLAGRCVKECPSEGFYEVGRLSFYHRVLIFLIITLSDLVFSQATLACNFVHDYLEECTEHFTFEFCMDSPLITSI